MAKMFYNMQETQNALGADEEQVKQLAREGRLREFRDGRQLMFKVDQVEQLKAELGGEAPRDHVDLGPSDTGAPIGLVDSRGASGTSITLTDAEAGSGLAKDDTALAGDIGLSDSVTAPGASGTGSAIGLAGSQPGASGISVFQSDEVEEADPSAQTAISPGADDQFNLEGAGSGSGLLDLTRESDDTSLGAELLDEIAPGDTGRAPAEMERETIPAPRGGVTRAGAPVFVEAVDPLAPAFGAAALSAFVMVLFAGYALLASLVGTWPDLVQYFDGRGFWWPLGIGVVLTIVFFLVGLIIGKMRPQ